MAIDQRDVSSTLRFMDDRALQQYAALHKNDPYIFPLAFQESQNRQRLRMQQQVAQAAQPQPKVTEQALAQMAPQPMPETQGIGALPARNMQQMADGGIAGYDDDANFAQRSEPVVMMAEGGVARYQVGGETMGGFGGLSPEQTAALELKAENEKKLQQLTDLEKQVAFLTSVGAPQAQQARAQLDALKSTMGPKPSPTDTSFRRQEDPRMKPGVAATAQPLITSDAAPKVDTTRRNTAATESARKEPAAEKEPTGLDALVKKLTRETELAQGALRNQRVGFASQLEQEALGAKEEGEKRRKERGDVFASREARLAEREKGIAGLGDKYMGLALLQAGAAMMSTPGNLGSVIGKGIQVGSERYIAGIDKINAAKDKFAEARDRLEELRLNRDDMNEKEIKEENRAIRTARIQGQQLLTEGATKDLEMTTANMREFFKAGADAIQTDKKVAGQLAAAKISAAPQTPAQMQIALALGKGDLEAGLNKMRAIEAGKFSVSNSYADYLKAFAGKETITPPLSFANYAAQFGATLPR